MLHHYFEAEGMPSLLVDVTYVLGERIARVVDPEPEDGEVVLLVEDMPGRFEPPLLEVPTRKPYP